jgi:hypothetical protein
VPFDRFTEIVTSQVRRMQGRSAKDVAFRVAVKDGRVMLTAKVLSDGDRGGASEPRNWGPDAPKDVRPQVG